MAEQAKVWSLCIQHIALSPPEEQQASSIQRKNQRWVRWAAANAPCPDSPFVLRESARPVGPAWQHGRLHAKKYLICCEGLGAEFLYNRTAHRSLYNPLAARLVRSRQTPVSSHSFGDLIYLQPIIALGYWKGPWGISGGAKVSGLARSHRLYHSESSGILSPEMRKPSGKYG